MTYCKTCRWHSTQLIQPFDRACVYFLEIMIQEYDKNLNSPQFITFSAAAKTCLHRLQLLLFRWKFCIHDSCLSYLSIRLKQCSLHKAMISIHWDMRNEHLNYCLVWMCHVLQVNYLFIYSFIYLSIYLFELNSAFHKNVYKVTFNFLSSYEKGLNF